MFEPIINSIFEQYLGWDSRVIAIFGPTASGKSNLALEVANLMERSNLQPVIINYDAFQIYQDIPIISAQPSIKDFATIPHLLYGSKPFTYNASVANWLEEALPLIQYNLQNNKNIILVGGTGLYLKSLLEGISYIPEVPPDILLKATQDLQQRGAYALYNILLKANPKLAFSEHDERRIIRAYSIFLATGKHINEWHAEKISFLGSQRVMRIFLYPERQNNISNAERRIAKMLEMGAIAEVNQYLQKQQHTEPLTINQAIGIKEIASYLSGEIDLNQATLNMLIRTRQYIKRQSTWGKNQLSFDKIIS